MMYHHFLVANKTINMFSAD